MSKRGSGSSTRNNGSFSGVVAIEVTTKDGTRLSYRSRQGGFITGIDDARESPASGRMTVPEIAKHCRKALEVLQPSGILWYGKCPAEFDWNVTKIKPFQYERRKYRE